MDHKQITELMADAESCPRLTKWEEDFCNGVRDKLNTYGTNARFSSKMIEVLENIERKVYV